MNSTGRVGLLLVLCVVSPGVFGQDEQVPRCPGRYCGRRSVENGSFSSCGACPLGWRVDSSHQLCTKCTEELTSYDWLYLAFMAGLPFLFNCYATATYAKSGGTPLLYISIVLEVTVAAIFSLLSFEPKGSLNINSCGVREIADWYPVFFNPRPDYVSTTHCTQEVVHPLYSLVFVYIAFSLVLTLIARPLLLVKSKSMDSSLSVYAALYFLPVLAISHAVAAGIVYYTFPYFSLIASLVSSALLYSRIEQPKEEFKNIRLVLLVAIHILLHMFAISAILFYWSVDLQFLVVLGVVPLLFFLITRHFTDPRNLRAGDK